MSNRRLSPTLCSCMNIFVVIIALTNGIIFLAAIINSVNGLLAHASAINYLAKALLSKDAELPLQDKHFNVTAAYKGEKYIYAFNLTNGTFHTKAKGNSHTNDGFCTAEKKDIDVTCRVTTVGWYATYKGSIYNGTDPFGEQTAESFNVSITMTEYQHPHTPADITVYLEKKANDSELTVRAFATEFIININTIPEFQDLEIFHRNKKLAKIVKAGFDEHIWDKIKPDMKEALKDEYARHIKKQINFLR
uniref:Uncharacterized protein n=1 Tax=Rhipicephalus appendiculatus TaxID=34631 RepID=A0A131YP32_RHIAP